MSQESNNFETLCIRPICKGVGAAKAKALTVNLPVVLGRKDLATLWWHACPCRCQAWDPNCTKQPCWSHCRQLRKNVSAISKSMLEIPAHNKPVRITAKHPQLVHWRGPKAIRKSSRIRLIIGTDIKHPWMVFSIVAMPKHKKSWFRAASEVVGPQSRKSKRRLLFSSSDESSDSMQSCSHHWNDPPHHPEKPFYTEESNLSRKCTKTDEEEHRDTAFTAVVVHRKTDELPRKVTPGSESKQFPTPRTQPYMSPGVPGTADRDSSEEQQGSQSDNNDELRILSLPRPPSSSVSEDHVEGDRTMMTTFPQPPKRQRVCSELTLVEWRRLKLEATPTVKALANAVLELNTGRGEDSPHLLLPDLVRPDTTVIFHSESKQSTKTRKRPRMSPDVAPHCLYMTLLVLLSIFATPAVGFVGVTSTPRVQQRSRCHQWMPNLILSVRPPALLQLLIPRHSRISKNLEEMGVLSAQEALVSPAKARRVRRNRSRGRLRRKRGNAQLTTSVDDLRGAKPLLISSNMRPAKVLTTLSYNVTIHALRAYHAQHGDLIMPRRYIVPHDEETYPQAWWGLDLSSVYSMKWWQTHVKQRSERVVELSELGFCWQRLQPEWNLILEALINYTSLYGDTMVPISFAVPRSKDWPAATWGIPLGRRCAQIRGRNDFLRDPHSAASRRDQLDGLGFLWESPHAWRFRKFFVALRFFAHIHGVGKVSQDRIQPLIVPSDFVVPEGSDIWPEELWGYPLGAKCIAVRTKELYVKDNPQRRALLDGLGFHWSGNADLSWLKVVHAAAIYSKLHNRQLDVPARFRVPRRPQNDGDDWPWPEYLWDLPLGQRLRAVRTHGAYLKGELGEKRRHQLEALGFQWQPQRGRPSKRQNLQTESSDECKEAE